MLNMDKKRKIGTIDDDAVSIYDYGSKFFAISEDKELLEKSYSLFGSNSFSPIDIVTSEKSYEYLEDVGLTHNENYTISAVLDKNNCFVNGYKIDLLSNTIESMEYLVFSNVDYEDYENYKEDEIFIKVLKKIFNDESISELSCLEEYDDYFIFVVFQESVALFVSDECGERIVSYNLNENVGDKEAQMATSALLAEERLQFDQCSLMSLDEIENRQAFEYIKTINSVKLSDVKDVVIADVLDMNYKSLNKSPKKEMYFELYKQKLMNFILNR